MDTTTTSGSVTAAEMAKGAKIDPKRFRDALRKAGLKWHDRYARWKVQRNSPEHHDMLRVLNLLSV